MSKQKTNTHLIETKSLTEKTKTFFDQKWSLRQSKRRKRSISSFYSDQSSNSGFHPYLQSSQTIEFLSNFNFSDPLDGSTSDRGVGSNSEDPTPIVPVTEMSDLELRRLGFPVPATTTESVYVHGFAGPGSGHDLSSVIDSPYIKFTSRK